MGRCLKGLGPGANDVVDIALWRVREENEASNRPINSICAPIRPIITPSVGESPAARRQRAAKPPRFRTASRSFPRALRPSDSLPNHCLSACEPSTAVCSPGLCTSARGLGVGLRTLRRDELSCRLRNQPHPPITPLGPRRGPPGDLIWSNRASAR